jgi:hypothetical protein
MGTSEKWGQNGDKLINNYQKMNKGLRKYFSKPLFLFGARGRN